MGGPPVNVKNRERVLVDDPGMAITLPARIWSAILSACRKRAAEAGGAPAGGTLDQAIQYLTEKTVDQPTEAPLKLKGRMSGFCLMCDACIWVGEAAGRELTIALSASEFPRPKTPDQMTPSE